MFKFNSKTTQCEELNSKFNRTNCRDDAKAYVEYNAGSRLFRVVVEDVDFFSYEKKQDHGFTAKLENKTVQIEMSVSEDSAKAESQFKGLKNFIARLGTDSHNNKFYLSRADFFQRQCDAFEKLLFNRSQLKANRDAQSSHAQDPGSYSC
ncbi:hypothetical protein B1207_03100 [Legionella quinlivanii]|uniref:Uncharacterized protein n=1 Tax=Legionella quinlivanii TaxID=45073 RepID=A0A364LMB1_9GAMM|nr:hypothetical protein [Legionella quinlivanii]RAP37990.1 hypothetical protein B1207_03100 [Legionella quinlivanii]